MTNVETVEDVETVTKMVMRPPKQFNVVLYNDDTTTVEFVVLVLMTIFHKNFNEANALTIAIHENGKGIAGTYSLEVANQKHDDTISAARLNGFPLRCSVQEC
jgi:ATP-dependent Clp protease adaptor protein ClpS